MEDDLPGDTGRAAEPLRGPSSSSSSSLLLSSKDVLEFHKHKYEPGGHHRDSMRAVEILRRSFGSTVRDPEEPKDPETAEPGPELDPDERDHGTEDERMRCSTDSLREKLEDPCDADGHLHMDPNSRSREHVYCSVYCTANDHYRTDKTSDHQPSSSSLISPPTDSELPNSDYDPYPVPYTVSDLMVSGLNDSYNAHSSFSVVLTCRICLDDRPVVPLHCCKKAVCEECMKRYISSQVNVGRVHLLCPITECSGVLEESLVASHLTSEELTKYKYFLELSRLDSSTKPCPQCSLFTALKIHGQQTSTRTEHKYKIQCTSCQFVWCFKCHAPWHEGLKCRDYRKGDKLLRHWASVIEHGQRNAQKCPRCKIHIQRTEGCDHMTCTQCNTNFCYRCGEKYRHLRFFGDHTSNLSVFGCKYRYLPDKPHLRRLVRGSVCMGKMLLAPLLFVLVVIVGAVALVIGLFALPIYYICKRRRKRTQGSGRWLC